MEDSYQKLWDLWSKSLEYRGASEYHIRKLIEVVERFDTSGLSSYEKNDTEISVDLAKSFLERVEQEKSSEAFSL